VSRHRFYTERIYVWYRTRSIIFDFYNTNICFGNVHYIKMYKCNRQGKNWEEVIDLTITVEVRKGNLEKAMRVLKKKVQKEGIIKDLRAKQYYEKPSEVRRRKKKEGIKNFKKKMKKLELIRGY